MKCDFADSLLQGYFDGELTAAATAEFERHLQHCVHCTVELVDLDLLSGRLQLAQLYEAAPAWLRKKTRADLRPFRPRPPSPSPSFGTGWLRRPHSFFSQSRDGE